MNITTPAKGMTDRSSDYIYARNDMITKITNIFEIYGGNPIDTPILERIDMIKNIYGEDFTKEVYNVGEKYILRYDLTVPCARYMENNNISNYKRYQIGKVYRKDQPQVTKGRYREFYQADFDIIGTDNDQLMQELEILNLLKDILRTLLNSEDKFKIKINDKRLLVSALTFIGIPDNKMRTICSSIDKINKLTREGLIEELNSKIDGKLVIQIIDFLGNISKDTKNILNYGVDRKIYDNILSLCDNNIYYDPTLARGLDYYTGLIYEATIDNYESSVAAGGRYNDMIGRIKNNSEDKIPAIGLSIGIDRLLLSIEKDNRKKIPLLFVASAGKDLGLERMKICLELRRYGYYTETLYSLDPTFRKQFNSVFEGIPIMIIIGENEIKNNTVGIKFIDIKKQITIDRKDMVNTVAYIDKFIHENGNINENLINKLVP